ncbi:hypothetical protein [uncultured Demequina sp.]|uniref:hypothetical protein n=1 Tax=uncultured Demequina sp. TaxID=693499 RepID=UPI0025E8ACE2|nr:hypothetical protein [uncultured Demequina sp.]
MADVLGSDLPIDGDPDTIEEHASAYGGIADAIRATSENLAAVVNSDVSASDAVDAFSEAASTVHAHLNAVDQRYDALAHQLMAFSTELRWLQERARVVMAEARQAHADGAGLEARAEVLRDHVAALDPQDPSAWGQQSMVEHLDAQVRELHAVVAARSHELDGLIDDWRRAAQGCALAIRGEVEGSTINDSAWDRMMATVEAVVHELLPLIEIVLDILAVVLTIAAVLVVLTGAGAALAPALFAVARLATVASKIVRAVKVALTTILVCAGRASPLALAAIGVDAAVGKIGGKVADAAVGGVATRFAGSRLDDVARFVGAVAVAPDTPSVTWVGRVIDASHSPAVRTAETVADTAVDVFPGFGLAKGVDEGLTLMSAWYPSDHPLNGWSLMGVELTLDVAGLYGRTGAGPHVPTSPGGLLLDPSSGVSGQGADAMAPGEPSRAGEAS